MYKFQVINSQKDKSKASSERDPKEMKEIHHNKNLDLELMRFVMILAVCLLHFSEDFGGGHKGIGGGYLGVDFFFLVGGIFLAKHYDRCKSAESPVIQAREYLKARLKRLYPPYLCAVVLMVMISFVRNHFSLYWLLNHLYETKWQYLFLHYLGADVLFEMRSIWYMSVYVVISYLVYFLLAYREELFVGLAPIFFLLIMVHIYVIYGSLSMQSAYEGWISGGVMRGFAEMSFGTYLYCISREDVKKGRMLVGWKNRIVTIMEGLTLLAIIFCIRQYGFDENDFFILLLIICYIRLSFVRTQKYKITWIRRVIIWLGSLNYWMFLLHLPISRVITHLLPDLVYWEAIVIYMLSVMAVSSVMRLVETKAVRRVIKRRRISCN